MNVQLAVLIAYAVLLVGVGLFVSRRVKKADDFLVAGRSLSPALIATTFLASNIGAGSTVGATGLGYVYGLDAWWWVGSAGIGTLILANTVGPKIWTLAKAHGWRTVGDFLDFRYSRAVRGLIAVLLWFGTLMILAAQLIAIGKILQVVVGLEKWKGCAIGGVVVAIYFSAGGLFASAWVNVIQLTVKLVGFTLAIPFGIAAAGGWSALQPAMEASTPLGPRGVLNYLFILVPSFIVSPGLIQKLYGARDARAVRVGVNVNAIGLLAFAFIPAIIGVIAQTKFPGLPDRELALPTVMTQLLPAWLGLLTLAAIFSAELSASDAALFMLSSSLSVDLYKTFLKPEATDRDLLRVGRITGAVAAVAGTLLAIGLPSVISALQIFYTVMAAALSGPLIVGLYSLRPGPRRAIVAIVVAVAITAFMRSGPSGTITSLVIMLIP
jgi:SSS family solute:Na+ symporter